MSNPVKLTLYILLALIAGVSAFFAIGQWKSVMDRPPVESELERIDSESTPPMVVTEQNASAESVTNLTDTNAMAAALPETGGTNTTGAVDTAATINPPAAEATAAAEPREENLEDVDVSVPTALGGRGNTEGKKSRVGLWSGMFLLSLVGLQV